MSSNNPPTDVMLDFLSRLTVRTLHVCRCVSREWLNAISNPQLRILHRQFSRRCPSLLVLDNIDSIYIVIVTDMAGAILNRFTVDLPVTSSFSIIHYAFCELICFSVNYEHLYICNPSTQELAAVPNSPYSFNSSASSLHEMGFFASTTRTVLAIGRLPSLNQYKIVRFFVHNLENGTNASAGEVFTIRDGVRVESSTWRMIGRCPCSVSPTSHACVGGAIYWPVADQALRHQNKHILFLDLETEGFGFISGPPDYVYGVDDDDDFISYCLVEMKGYLCFVNRHQPLFVLDVWMLTDPANGIWIKEHSINLPALDHHCLIQCYIVNNHGDESLVIYMPSQQWYYYYNIQTGEFSLAENLNGRRLKSYFVYYDNFFSLGTR